MKKFLLFIAFVVVAVGAYAAGSRYGMLNSENTDPRIASVRPMLIGIWNSEEDRNFNREYKDDGTVIDSYASGSGEVLDIEARWSLFTEDMNEKTDFPQYDDDVYIKDTGGDGSTMYFRIVTVTSTELELMNMERGNMLRFGKLTTGHELQDGQEDPILASFRCDDQSSFIAEFTPDMEKVGIASEGETNYFPLVSSGSGMTYENATWTFVFKGETATVTDRTLKTTKICNPPLDTENAPMHFGD